MKIIIALALASSVTFAIEAPYYRFWRGVKRTHHVREKLVDGRVVRDAQGFKVFETDPNKPMSWDDFADLVNRWLIPATTSCCAQPSLVAYLPALTRRGEKPNALHDEIALIVYRSEKAYQDTRADITNREAISYGPLHGDVFEMADKKSRSLVPTPYRGAVALNPESAYDLLETSPQWQSGHTQFRIHTRPAGMSDARYLASLYLYFEQAKAAATLPRIDGHLTLVTPQYLIEYLHFSDANFARAFQTSAPNAFLLQELGAPYQDSHARLTAQIPGADPLRYESLNWESAASLLFEPGRKPTPAARHHRLE